jgi:hypothetical protein
MRAQRQSITRAPIDCRGRDLRYVEVFRAVIWVELASWASDQAAVRGDEISTNLGN